MSICQDSPL